MDGNASTATADLTALKALLDASALLYDADQHGGLAAVAAYRTRTGARHEVCINLHPDLDWRVIDVSPDGSATFVGRLEGADDLRSQAVAYARDYATQAQLFHHGCREDPPILRPKTMRMSYRTPTDAPGVTASPRPKRAGFP
jgi:hypothetical protein